MNADRFRELANRIEGMADRPGERFSMSLFLSGAGWWVGKVIPEVCETAGCIAGWAYVMFARSPRPPKVESLKRKAAKVLGLPEGCSSKHLFYAWLPGRDAWRNLSDITEDQAARVLRGIADWVDRSNKEDHEDDDKVSKLIMDLWYKEFKNV